MARRKNHTLSFRLVRETRSVQRPAFTTERRRIAERVCRGPHGGMPGCDLKPDQAVQPLDCNCAAS